MESCKYSIGSCNDICEILTERFAKFSFQAKIKVGISGCKRCCAIPKVRDLGFLATTKGWELYFGGNPGNQPRIADCIGAQLTINEVCELACKALLLYDSEAMEKERTSKFMERYGTENFKTQLKWD